MIDINDPSSAPTVNEEFLSQNQTIGGVINPEAIRPTAIQLPKISSAPHIVPQVGSPGSIPHTPAQVPTKSKDFADSLFDHMKAAPDYAQDQVKYGKTWAYDADYSGIFYKRYADQTNVYNKLGFSPWRDNETAYNKESTWLDNFKRSFSNAGTLANLAFKETLPWNAWSGTGDISTAKVQERAFAKGSDTRGTAGAWINNQVLNAGFSVGIAAEFAAEEAAAWAVGTAASSITGGAGFVAAAAETGAAINKMKRAFTVAEMSKNIAKAYEYTKSLDWARDFYKGIASGKTIKNIAKSVTPFTLDHINELGRLSKAGHEINGLAATARGVGAFYKDVRGVNATLSESKMEAGSVELQLRDKLIDDFYQTHGKMPSTQDYADIYATAKDGAVSTYWWNLPAIYLSNKIVFEKMLTGFKPFASTREALTQGFKNYGIREVPLTAAEEAAGGLRYKAVKVGLREDFKSLFQKETWKPANLTKNFIKNIGKYSAANITEGLQEQFQDGISGAMKNYYQDRYEHPDLAGSRSSWGYLGESMAKQATSKEGWSTFASGFTMGGLLQFPQHLIYTGGANVVEYARGKENYKQARVAEENRVNETVNSLNETSKFLGQYLDPKQERAVAALRNVDELAKAAKNGDKYAHLNIQESDMNDHIYTLAQTGKLELIKDQINDYLKMTPQEMEEGWGKSGKTAEETGAYYTKKLNDLKDLADNVSERYDNINEAYGNPFNEWRFNPKSQPREFMSEKQARMDYEEAKKVSVMSSLLYDQTAGRIKSLIGKAATAKPVAEASASDFQILYDQDGLDKEINNLTIEIPAYGLNAKNNRQDAKTLKDKEERLKLLTEFRDENKAFISASEAFEAGLTDPNSELALKAKAASAVRKGATVTAKVSGKKNVSFVVDKVVGEWAYDKAGKRYKRKNLNVTKSAKSEYHEDEFMDEAAMKLHEAYSNYVKHIAKVNNTTAFDKNITDSFKDYVDFTRLTNDRHGLAKAVNVLNNPRAISEFAQRKNNLSRAMDETRLEVLKKAFKEYKRKMGVNTVLNKLYEIGVFMEEDDLKAFTENHVVSNFYHVTEGHALVDPKSEKYKEALKVIEDWENEHNEQYKKPIQNVVSNPEDAAYSGKGRSKINNDVRTYKEHAAYWGFDPALAESFVNSRAIIQKIIDSPYATYEEKLLARKMLTAVSADSRVRFNKEGRPGYFAYTADAKTGVTIDARFYSNDFDNGGSPIEVVLLHEFIHELTSQEMDNNPAFKAEITKLFELAKAAFKKDPKKKPFYGLKNEHEFVAEVMSNSVFRTYLQGIKFEGARKSVWTEFVDSIKRMLSAILGVSQDSSLLDEALYVITSKVDEFYGATKAPTPSTGGIPAATSMGKLTPGSSIAQFETAGLIPILVETFKNFVDFNKANGSTAYDHLTTNRVTDDVIKAMPEFKEFLALGKPEVTAIINKHNGVSTPIASNVGTTSVSDIEAKKQKIADLRTQEQAEYAAMPDANNAVEKQKIYDRYDKLLTPLLNEVAALENTSTGQGQSFLPLTIPERSRLNDREFGYSYPEINRMTPQEGRRILSQNLTKTVLEEQAEASRQLREQEIFAQRAETVDDIKNKINNVEHIFEFAAIQNEIAMASVADPQGVDVDALMRSIEQKKRELANPTYDKIQERETVMMMNGFKKTVISKANGIIKLRNFGQNDGYVEEVLENEVASKIKYRYEPGMEEVVFTPPISEENEQASNEALVDAPETTTTVDAVANAVVDTRTQEEIDKELDDDLGC